MPMAARPRAQCHRRPRQRPAQGPLWVEHRLHLQAWWLRLHGMGWQAPPLKHWRTMGVKQWTSSRHCSKATFRRWAWNINQRRMLRKAIQAAVHSKQQPSAPHPAWVFPKHCCRCSWVLGGLFSYNWLFVAETVMTVMLIWPQPERCGISALVSVSTE